MKWFLPSWYGDVRVEPDPEDEKRSRILVHSPTEGELQALALLSAKLVKKGWIKEALPGRTAYRSGSASHAVDAPLDKLVPLVVEALKPGKQTLSAIVLKDGKIETAETMAGVEELAKRTAKAGASVTRPTPCCPDCYAGAVGPATEALLAFLSAQQHAQWAETRSLIAIGQLTGHRYLLAHRHTPQAMAQRRICMDIDDDVVVHFHDQSVPPEEEVLAAKLILEHREPWLRNEATFFEVSRMGDQPFKNPFGDWLDGTFDAGLTDALGQALRALHPGTER